MVYYMWSYNIVSSLSSFGMPGAFPISPLTSSSGEPPFRARLGHGRGHGENEACQRRAEATWVAQVAQWGHQVMRVQAEVQDAR